MMFQSSEATATKNRQETNFWREISGPEPDLLDESQVLMNYKLRQSINGPTFKPFKPEVYLSCVALESQVSFKVFF